MKWKRYSTEDKIRILRAANGGQHIVGTGNPKTLPRHLSLILRQSLNRLAEATGGRGRGRSRGGRGGGVCGAASADTIGCRCTEGVGGAVSDTGQSDGPSLSSAIFLQKNGRPAA